MKKLALVASVFLVSACTNNFAINDPVEKRDNLKHICIKEAKNPRLASFVPSLANSLKTKGITSEVFVGEPPKNCAYLLTYALNARNNLVLRSTVRVHELDGNSYDEIGEVVYKQRSSEEQALSKANGVQGQTDRIVAQLFSNY